MQASRCDAWGEAGQQDVGAGGMQMESIYR